MTVDSKRRFAALAAGFALLLWLVALACYLAPSVASGVTRPREDVYHALSAMVGLAFSILLYGLFARLGRLRRAATVGIAGGALILVILAHSLIDLWMIENYLRARVVLGPKARLSGEGFLLLHNLLLLAPVHLTYAIGLGLGFSLRAIREREQRLAAALAAKQEAQLAALRFQINPHFLFNSLNAVMSLVGSGRSREAETVVTRLAEFFRATLSSEPDAIVTLEEELDVLGAYLDIEAARFGERLRVVIDLPDELARASVPHFLLQPLAENAVKHGVAPSKRAVTLTVSALARDGRLVVQVRDDGAGGAGPSARGEGVGLRNIAARLRAHYGDGAALRSERQARGFLAEVALPLSFTQAAA